MTFTNKAANEMKIRVLEALIDLKVPNHEKTKDQLQFLANISSEIKLGPKLVELRAHNILNKILHNYSSFSIMTIDKFTHKIIRTFAKDLGVSIDFDVEMDVSGLRRNITDLLFEKIGRNVELTRLMKRYANDNLQDDKSWNFSNQLYEFSDILFKEDAIKSIAMLRKLKEKDFNDIKDELVKENSQIENSLIRMATEAKDLISSKLLEADDFQGKGNSIVKYFIKISAGNFGLSKDMKSPASPTLKGYVNDEKWGHPKSPNKGTADDIGDLLAKYFHQIEGIFETSFPKVKLNKEILKNINNLSLLNHLLKIVDEVKEEENILLISDFYKKISDVIAKEPVPFIYERLGVRYEHFLLDEFQDTSHLQWVNMIPLVHNSLASGNLNLIVGDGKQAIYRWRNGEVEQFTKLPEKIHNPDQIESLNEAEILFKSLGEKIPLENNYRSAKEIITFNNSLFETLSKNISEPLQYIFNDVKQNSIKKHAGYVHAYFEEKIDEVDQLEYVLKSIKTSIDTGYNLKDICIIVRNNYLGSLLANYLTEHNIDVISPDSLFIGKDSTVKFIYHVMSAIVQPKDNNYKIKALEHYATITNQNPTKIIQDKEKYIKENTLINYFSTLDVKVSQPDSFHNLYEFVESLIEVFNLNPTYNPFLQFFLELVHQFETKNNSNIRDFLTWYIDKGHEKSIVSPAGANAIQIMTIHKSKGLQFPVVICPFMDWKFDLSRQIAWVNNDGEKLPAFFLKITKALKDSEMGDLYDSEEGKYYLDQLNLLYVAFTRPETALFISGNLKSNHISKNWLLPYFENSYDFKLNDFCFESGVFELNKKSTTKNVAENYPLSFLKQKMNKPELSYKSGAEWDVNDIDEKRNFGTLVHRTLSHIESKSNLEPVLTKMLDKGEINPFQLKEISNYIKSLFLDEHFSNYFNVENEILNEKSIINKNGQKLIPDKIIITDTETIVVDFKTGQATESHQKQLYSYIKVLRDMDYEKVRGEIYYTEKKETILIG
jgi:ATP-dependent exoDNAse (exonuclease V) beta subunit